MESELPFDPANLPYIEELYIRGEYDEMLTFLLTVLPNTKVEFDHTLNAVILYLDQAELIEDMDETVTEFNMRLAKLNKDKSTADLHLMKRHLADSVCAGQRANFTGTSQQEQFLNNFFKDMSNVGIQLEAWQKEELQRLSNLWMKDLKLV